MTASKKEVAKKFQKKKFELYEEVIFERTYFDSKLIEESKNFLLYFQQKILKELPDFDKISRNLIQKLENYEYNNLYHF